MIPVTPVIFLLLSGHAGMGQVARFKWGRYEYHYSAGARDCGLGGFWPGENRRIVACAEGCTRAGDYALALPQRLKPLSRDYRYRNAKALRHPKAVPF
jgi:hypothetical protein